MVGCFGIGDVLLGDRRGIPGDLGWWLLAPSGCVVDLIAGKSPSEEIEDLGFDVFAEVTCVVARRPCGCASTFSEWQASRCSCAEEKLRAFA